MALFKMFCFWFSVRMGCVMIGIIYLIQASICLMITIIGLGNNDDLKEVLRNYSNDLGITNKFLLSIAENPDPYVVALTIFFCLFLLACALLILGAYKCINILLVPFLILDTIYLFILLGLLVFMMLHLKAGKINLGMLILYSNLGVFILLYLLYLLLTVVSFRQILFDLQGRINGQIQIGSLYPHQRKTMLVKYSKTYARKNFDILKW